MDSKDFKGEKIKDCKFDWADLSAADFSGTTIENTSFYRATLIRTNFSGCYAPNIDFKNAYEIKALKFNGSNLEGASFNNKFLTFVDFRNANLKNSDFRNTNYIGSSFYGANLANADFRFASMDRGYRYFFGGNRYLGTSRGTYDSRIDLRCTNVAGANFDHANLKTVRVRGMYNVSPGQFDKTRLNFWGRLQLIKIASEKDLEYGSNCWING